MPRPPAETTSTIGVADETALGPLAHALVAALPGHAFLALNGDLGAGKTTFVKALAAALGNDPTTVISPTFGLIHLHDGPHGRLLHADMYRLADPGELHETGWDDAVAAADVACVEWPERIAAALPDDRLDVTITIESPTSRTLTFVARGPAHAPAVAAVAAHAGRHC
jgi:tRNA threonylcarbamoyl adenosine modification protein YjeE